MMSRFAMASNSDIRVRIMEKFKSFFGIWILDYKRLILFFVKIFIGLPAYDCKFCLV